MNVIYIPKDVSLANLDQMFVGKKKSEYEMKIEADLMGYRNIPLEEAKKICEVGDYFAIPFEDRVVPWVVAHKLPNGDCIMHSVYSLGSMQFDKESNNYETSAIRKYLNGDFLKKFPKKFVDAMKVADVPYLDKVLHDKMFLPSHEEIGHKDKTAFKPNKGAFCFDCYKDEERRAQAENASN